MKLFARLQTEMMEEDRAVMRRVVEQAIHTGRLPAEALHTVEIRITPPSLKVRDERQEAEVYRIEHEAGILSPQTWSQLRGLDYEQERANWLAAGK